MKSCILLEKRPSNIPESWVVFNAARPLPGHEYWEGEFHHGIFYAAINPEGYNAHNILKSNIALDGWLVHYYNENLYQEWRTNTLKKHGKDIDELNERMERWLKETYLQDNWNKEEDPPNF